METWYQIAALSVGGVLGVNARYWLGVLINRWAGSAVPVVDIYDQCHRFICNRALYCFSGTLVSACAARLVVVVGFLGGYTTFSSYSFESLALWERGERMLCLVYMFGSVAGGFAGVVLGTALGRGTHR